MKSILVAYLLWLLGGPFFGLHKFYLGRPFMGLLYIFTCGGFFLGWIADFFTLPHQVQMANFLLHQHEQPSSAVRRELEHLKYLLYRRLAGDRNRDSKQLLQLRELDGERLGREHVGELYIHCEFQSHARSNFSQISYTVTVNAGAGAQQAVAEVMDAGQPSL